MSIDGPRRADTPQATRTDILQLVQRALNQFDEDPLDATVRRVVRIANLLGDTFSAVRLGLELKPARGHPPANAEAIRRLMADPSTWGQGDSIAEHALDEYMVERRFIQDGEALVLAYSLAEINFWDCERKREDFVVADRNYANFLNQRLTMSQIVTRTQHHAFTLLCSWERQLTFAVTQATALDAVSNLVDELLTEHAPDVLSQFNVAFRRLHDQAGHADDVQAGEELSQALSSCRRILKAVVDIVQPVERDHPITADGKHNLTEQQYKNRLVQFLKAAAQSGTFRSALASEGESIFTRFAALDSLASKGVHARVAVDEAEFCALHTYLLAGEIIALRPDGEPSRA